MTKEIALILHNIRSTHNVGSIFRSSDGFAIDKLYLTGYTPYPKDQADSRLPHIADKLDKQIHKTALGAENTVAWEYQQDPKSVIEKLRTSGYVIAGLEQAPGSINISRYSPPGKLALILGEEVDGIDRKISNQCDVILEIPMKGKKESFNVSIAAAIALYQFTFR